MEREKRMTEFGARKYMNSFNRRLITSVMTFICCSIVIAPVAQAKEQSTLELGGVGNFNFFTWAAGDGSLTDSSIHCLASSNYSNKYQDPPPVETPAVERQAYSFEVIDAAAAAGYYLYLGGDTALTGNSRIAVQFSHQDLADASGYEILLDETYDTHSHIGGYSGCRDGDNSQLKVDISAADLEQVKNGTYQGDFTAQAQGGSTGTDTDTSNFRIDLKVATVVRISGLNDINIGDYFGGGSLLQEETFCVYANTAGSDYTISITGTNQDVAGAFFVADAAVVKTIPYLLQFKADVTAGAGTTVALAALSGVGNNSSSVCSGVDNAKLTLSATAVDLAAALPDVYNDTLTLLVAPL